MDITFGFEPKYESSILSPPATLHWFLSFDGEAIGSYPIELGSILRGTTNLPRGSVCSVVFGRT